MDFGEFATVAKRHYHFDFFRTLKLRFERYRLATVFVLRFVSDVDLASLIGSCVNCRAK